MTKTVLYISQYFFPNDVIGAKRALNLCTYLPEFEWTPIVFTLPESEDSHFADFYLNWLPKTLIVKREFIGVFQKKGISKTYNDAVIKLPPKRSKNFFNRYVRKLTPLDQYMWDIPQAYFKAKTIVKEYDAKLILVNASPFSGCLLGYWLSRRFDIPLILDFRDPWSIDPVRMEERSQLTLALTNYLERLFLQRAAKIVLNTRACCEAYQVKYQGIVDPQKFTFVRNAYEPRLWPAVNAEKRPFLNNKKRTITYFGTMRQEADLLLILNAISEINRKNKEVTLHLEIFGEIDFKPPNKNIVSASPYLQLKRPLPYAEMIRIAPQKDILLLIDADDRALKIPAKLFDYLGAGQPILAITNNLEVKKIIEKTKTGIIVPYGNKSQIKSALETLVHLEKFAPNEEALYEFTARKQAEKFNNLLNTPT